jgi:hypothetical protein
MLDLSVCQKCRKGNRRFNLCILRTRTREEMKESKISRVIVMAAIIFVSFWGFLCGCVMCFTLKRKYMWYKGSSKDFGTIVCCDVKMITSIYFVLSFCLIFERNHVICGVASVGILLLKDELPHSLTISWLFEWKSKEV